MYARPWRFPLLVIAATLLAADLAWAIEFGLGQSKAELKLEYDVSVVDHGTGRVTVTLKIASEGRLAPLTSVELMIADKAGPGHVDLSVPLATRDEDGNRVVRVHLTRELAERAAIRLKTSGLDGKPALSAGYFHSISFAPYLRAR
jgi:hypothetical protein